MGMGRGNARRRGAGRRDAGRDSAGRDGAVRGDADSQTRAALEARVARLRAGETRQKLNIGNER
jgi:hypothetical protein